MSTTKGRPFDLEAAKRGEKIENYKGEPAYFVGVEYDGQIVYQMCFRPETMRLTDGSELRMTPRKRTIYIQRSELSRNKGSWATSVDDIVQDGSQIIAVEIEA